MSRAGRAFSSGILLLFGLVIGLSINCSGLRLRSLDGVWTLVATAVQLGLQPILDIRQELRLRISHPRERTRATNSSAASWLDRRRTRADTLLEPKYSLTAKESRRE